MNRPVLHFFSIIHQEAIIQLILEIAVSCNVALCVEAGFCQIQSQIWYVPLRPDNTLIKLMPKSKDLKQTSYHR